MGMHCTLSNMKLFEYIKGNIGNTISKDEFCLGDSTQQENEIDLYRVGENENMTTDEGRRKL